MSRGQQTFKQGDLTRALKATIRAGIVIERVEIDKNGKIIVVTAKSGYTANEAQPEKNEWDAVHR
jgi:hypothetical protein